MHTREEEEDPVDALASDPSLLFSIGSVAKVDFGGGFGLASGLDAPPELPLVAIRSFI